MAADVSHPTQLQNSTYRAIPVTQIVPSPHQARKYFDEEALRGLADSMKAEGLIEPIVVRTVDTGFELISGERRLRAARLIGWPTIEARVITTVSDAEAAVKGLIENLQRENLNPIEEAEGFAEIASMDPDYWTQGRIAQASGKSRVYVNKSFALLDLPPEVIEAVRQRTLTREHGIELMRINSAKDQKRIAHKVGKRELTVKQTRELITRFVDKKHGGASPVENVDNVPGTVPGTAPVAGNDPLSDIWETLLADPDIAEPGSWGVEYKPRKIWSDGGTARAWSFWMAPMLDEPDRKQLAAWFRRMADALK